MPKVIIYIVAGLLFVALFPLPYGYYQFLRLVVVGTFGYGAYISYQRKHSILPWLLGGIALLFNPLIPVSFDREIWAVLDVIVGAILLAVSSKVSSQLTS